MTEINPPYALQNAGATHTAENDRTSMGALLSPITNNVGGLIPRGGVNGGLGGGLKVTTASSGLTVNIASGVVFVAGTEGVKQGIYCCTNDATKAITLDTAHGTLPRIDRIVARVYDTAYSGALNQWALEKVTGTANASPVAPAVPANSISLASISVPAADTLIDAGQITDERIYIPQGITWTDQAHRPPLANTPDGTIFWNTDAVELQMAVGGTWLRLNYPGYTPTVNTFTAGGTWVKQPNVIFAVVEVIGGGGAGGGAPATAASQVSGGSGGQAGAYCRSIIRGVDLPANVAVTVGAAGNGVGGGAGLSGGTSSFGAFVSAVGGAGGAANGAGGTNFVVAGGSSTQAMTGDIKVQGQPGAPCSRLGTQSGQILPGLGGSTIYGSGGQVGGISGGDGAAGTGYGAGGGGAANSPSSVARVGGAGAPGIVIVTQYY